MMKWAVIESNTILLLNRGNLDISVRVLQGKHHLVSFWNYHDEVFRVHIPQEW